MIRLFYSLALMLVSVIASVAFGQTQEDKIAISGRVVSPQQTPATDAIVTLIAGDGKIAKTEAVDENGNFTFSNIAKGQYNIQISVNGIPRFTGDAFTANENFVVGTTILPTPTTELSAVVVTKAKPYIERQQGKIILNVESSIGATGASAFEVLEKAPSVNVDQNDNISLRGKGGVIVQIDGKNTPLSGSNLANYLRGIPSSSVDKIEFITNPGAKYDAAGSAIINIKMKKDKRKGTNGTVTSSYSQGKYPRLNNSLSLNHRNKNVNVFGSYSFAYSEWFNDLNLDRRFFEDGNFTGRYDQINSLKMNFRNHIGRAGADWTVNKKHTLGIIANAVSNNFNPTGRNFSDVYDENDLREQRFITWNRSRDKWHNASVNLNHKYTIDTLGTDIITDFDYANYGNVTKQNFQTKYFDNNNVEFLPQYLLRGDLDGNLNIFALKSDFVKTLSNKIKLESGVKSSYVKADNDLQFFDVSSGTPIFDPTKSNHFIYTENINAAYVNASKDIGNWGFYLGFRVENTNITGEQLVDGTSFDDSYTQLFPSVFTSYKFNDNHSLEFNYSRRITRPSYEQLNPFKFFLDQTTYKEGNPYLKPQTTHSIEVTHVFKQKIYSTLSFSRTTDNITEVIAPSDDDPMITVQTDKNLNTADIVGLFIITPLDFTPWWNTNYSFNFYYGSYSGTVANTTLDDRGNFNFNCNLVNNFKLGNGYSAEVTGNYRGREIYAFMDVDPIWFLNLGVQKKWKQSTLKLAANDVFWTNRTTADSEFTNYTERFKVSRNTRVIAVSYTYNFGQGNNQPRRRTGGADDIKQRAGSANG
ncbi:Outer membrane protein beta-barrel domain-containing protein [Flavobacterium longum]|uniref:TonB-dependent receptor domain-containing protein n=1 Tax=Flavobacterium longum TaxID=1299340 RepID=UPI0039ED5CBB